MAAIEVMLEIVTARVTPIYRRFNNVMDYNIYFVKHCPNLLPNAEKITLWIIIFIMWNIDYVTSFESCDSAI
jgi:hypothetical protein